MLLKILGVILIIIGGIWILSRLLNFPKMISIFESVKETEGTFEATRRAVMAELFMGYGAGALLIYLGLRLLQ